MPGTVPGARNMAGNKINTVPAFIESRRERWTIGDFSRKDDK